MKLELVTHCWQYPRLLQYHLSGFCNHPPKDTQLTITIVHATTDDPTIEVLRYFTPRVTQTGHSLLTLPLPREQTCRRAIGRNTRALNTQADYIWFCDVDYVFGDNCLDTLEKAINQTKRSPLYYPQHVLYHRDHATGDKLIENTPQEPATRTINPEDFKNTRVPRAIGGLQIVPKGTAHRYGYCKDKPQEPTPSWSENHEDRRFRQQVGTEGQKIILPNLYRIRHSMRGADCPTTTL